ncbi:MAG: AlpA family phage regulatory protein [Gammaproteobacteria bacterium]|nr:AlpA family phage regulatory protein [Gammaproteobacteria bacterium]
MVSSIIRLKDAVKKTGISRSSIYLYCKAGTFPQPIKLGERSIGFVESEIEEWIEERIAESRSGQEVA